MKRLLLAAAASIALASPALAEGGEVFANAPNELPQFQHGTPDPAGWAGPFFHSQVRPPNPAGPMAAHAAPPGPAPRRAS